METILLEALVLAAKACIDSFELSKTKKLGLLPMPSLAVFFGTFFSFLQHGSTGFLDSKQMQIVVFVAALPCLADADGRKGFWPHSAQMEFLQQGIT